MPTPSNRAAVLSEIAFRARRSYRQSAVSYMETAAALAETRELCEHGKWGLWLAKTGIPVRTASRLLRLHAEGIKSATVADLGARHVDELLGRCPEILALVDHETGEPLAGDEVVRMAEIVDGTRTVYEWAHGHASRIGDQATLDMIADAFPDTYERAVVWLRWGGAIPETDDPEERRSWAESSPWLPGNLPPAPEPQPLAA